MKKKLRVGMTWTDMNARGYFGPCRIGDPITSHQRRELLLAVSQCFIRERLMKLMIAGTWYELLRIFWPSHSVSYNLWIERSWKTWFRKPKSFLTRVWRRGYFHEAEIIALDLPEISDYDAYIALEILKW